MCIYPDYSKFTFWFCHFDSCHGCTGNAMVTAEYYRKKIILQAIIYGLTYAFIHGHHSFDPFCIWGFYWFVQQFVFMRNFLRREMNEKIAHEIEGGYFDCINAKAGAPGSGCNF